MRTITIGRFLIAVPPRGTQPPDEPRRILPPNGPLEGTPSSHREQVDRWEQRQPARILRTREGGRGRFIPFVGPTLAELQGPRFVPPPPPTGQIPVAVPVPPALPGQLPPQLGAPQNVIDTNRIMMQQLRDSLLPAQSGPTHVHTNHNPLATPGPSSFWDIYRAIRNRVLPVAILTALTVEGWRRVSEILHGRTEDGETLLPTVVMEARDGP